MRKDGKCHSICFLLNGWTFSSCISVDDWLSVTTGTTWKLLFFCHCLKHLYWSWTKPIHSLSSPNQITVKKVPVEYISLIQLTGLWIHLQGWITRVCLGSSFRNPTRLIIFLLTKLPLNMQREAVKNYNFQLLFYQKYQKNIE